MLIELLTKRYPGMRSWLMQRFTAFFMAVYVVIALIRFIVMSPNDYASWLSFNQSLWWRLSSLIFWIILSLHAWLGIRDVFKDYVRSPTLRPVLVKLLLVLLWVYLAWAAYLFLFF